jgi:DNA-binding response OmpR family regulator
MSPHPSNPAAGSEDSPGRSGRTGLRVLLAEDDLARRAELAEVLTTLGYVLSTAATGEDAVHAYVQEPVPVVLLDIALSGVDGIEVCRRIRALDPARTTFVIVYCWTAAMERLLAALEAGADDYVLTPNHPQVMQARLIIAENRLAREEARRTAEADAAKARYLAGVGEMAIALQHEVNNPLAAILAHAELLAMDAEDSGEENESLQTILEQARRIADVVRRLSSLRNPTSVEYVPGKRMVHLKDDG